MQLQERGNQMVCLVFPEMLGRTGFGGYKEKSQMPMYTWTPTNAFNAHACADTHAHTHTCTHANTYTCIRVLPNTPHTHTHAYTRYSKYVPKFLCFYFSPILFTI